MKLIRFGVSIPEDLCRRFDAHIARKNYPNRSESIRDLIRNELIEEEIKQNTEVVGVLHLLYDHHKRELSDRLTDLQHENRHLVLSSMHIHLDHDNCIEVILIRGKAQEVKNLANSLIATKGVKHGRLNITSTGTNLA
ncbi:MAG TPA: nickel-responsive transcriptional regulator NikR [Caldithrix sp.]|nr:nickel-responsive transcriptional regulator NikR [Caldithrix sp.]